MSMQIKCDACGKYIDTDDELFCSDCVIHLEATIEKLEDRITELER